ncbi:MAG: hypothetical protein WC438_04075 [Candidatus Pacearchaeota archaeon]
MIKNFGFRYKGKKKIIKVEECRTLFEKARGLMFRKNSLPLLFYFNKPTNESIHSFFCKPFFAIWFLDNKIIDGKLVNSNKFSIKPKEKFNLLLEIPFNDNNFLNFVDERKV